MVAICGAVVKLMCANMHLTYVACMALKMSQLDKLKDRLKRWKEVTMREFTDRPDILLLIPDPDSIKIDKLGDGRTITTDTCNAAQKVRRMLVEYINETVNEQDEPSVLHCMCRWLWCRHHQACHC